MVLTEPQILVRDTAREVAQSRLAPYARAWEAAGEFPAEIVAELGALGYLGMAVPESLGGAGLDNVSYVLALIEIAAGDGAISTLVSVQNAPVCAILVAHGSREQQEHYLRPLASGQIIGAFALTEPSAGSDSAAIRTTARRVSGGYVLNGTKQFVTSGAKAGVIITFAVTDSSAGKRGISAFLVPTNRPGFRIGRTESKLGQRASDTVQLGYDELFVDEWLRIGEESEGYRIALANLEGGRLGIAAQSVGMAASALKHAIAYARERQSFGRSLSDHQAVAFRLADMATELEASRQLVLHAASLRDAGRSCIKEACMAKVFASERAERIVSAALQIFGGYGYTKDFAVEKIYRDVRVCQIYEGTSDIQRIIIARAL